MLEVNLKNNAISQTTAAFNSMCKFGDVYLGVTDSGLFQICGYSDDGIEIPTLIKSGIFDLKLPQKKKFRSFHFSGESTGDLKITIYADGIVTQSFNITPTGTGIFDFKVTYPMKIKARYWQWQIENIDGAFFVLYKVEAVPIVLHPGRNKSNY